MIKRMTTPTPGRSLHVSVEKFCIAFIALLIATNVNGQSNYQHLERIDYIVQQTDSLANKLQRTFYLNKIDKRFDGVKETWNYTLRDGKVAVFQVRYVIDSVEYMEVYYLDRGQLILSEEYETVYYNATGADDIKWGGIYYFVSNNLRQRVTLGRKRPAYLHWNIEAETLSRFRKRYSELRENIPLTAKN